MVAVAKLAPSGTGGRQLRRCTLVAPRQNELVPGVNWRPVGRNGGPSLISQNGT